MSQPRSADQAEPYDQVRLELDSRTQNRQPAAVMVLPFYRILRWVLQLFHNDQRVRFWSTMERTNFRVLGVTLPLGVFIKHTISAYEAEVLSYVAERTTIPVPIVIDSVQLKEDQFLLIMTRLPGNDLDSTFRDMTAEQTAHVTRQLSEFLAQIRAIPPPQPGVCGLGGGPIHDNRLSFGMYPWGPFGSVYEFHDYLVERAALRLDECEHPDEVLAVIKKSHSKCHRVYFTHGDFHPGNVLVDDEYNVTGIVDWEMAAWMPEYWDYTKSLYLPYYKSKKGKWFEVMTKIYPQYSDEIAAEIEIFNWRRCYN